MLIGIDPALSPDLLHALASMGHGDEIVVADSNFPAASVAASTTVGEPLRMDVSTPRAVEAILSLLPLDTFVPAPIARMAVVDDPDAVPDVQREVDEVLRRTGAPGTVESVERHAFYERAARAFAVVRTGERRFYGCVILVKGVIGPDE